MGSLALWKLSSILRSTSQPVYSSLVYAGHPRAEVAFSPDGKLLCTPIEVISTSTTTSCSDQGLAFIEIPSMESHDKNKVYHLVDLFIAQMKFPLLQSCCRSVSWSTSINQIICNSQRGVQVFYDREMSNKGVLTGINRRGRVNRDFYISPDAVSVG